MWVKITETSILSVLNDYLDELKLDVMDMLKIYYEERVEDFLLLWTA